MEPLICPHACEIQEIKKSLRAIRKWLFALTIVALSGFGLEQFQPSADENDLQNRARLERLERLISAALPVFVDATKTAP
jgi:hypothetical protein